MQVYCARILSLLRGLANSLPKMRGSRPHCITCSRCSVIDVSKADRGFDGSLFIRLNERVTKAQRPLLPSLLVQLAADSAESMTSPLRIVFAHTSHVSPDSQRPNCKEHQFGRASQ